MNPLYFNSSPSFPFFSSLAELAAEFITRPQNQEAVEGEKAEFSCSVSKDTYEVKWFRGDKAIETGDKYSIISEGKRRSLVVKNCELKDEGGYTAHIGTVKASADLLNTGLVLLSLCFIPEKLRIITPIKDTEVKEGREIVFNCETNTEGAKAKWLKNEETIFESSKYMMVQRDNVFSLRIKDAQKADEAVYTVSLTNHRGEQAKCSASAKVSGNYFLLSNCCSSPLFLYVHSEMIWFSTEEKLRFSEPIEDIETQEKKTISFVCKVNRPGATVRWMRAGQEVTLSKRVVYRADGLKHSLTIKDCIMEDEGEYTALVGDDKCAAELIISEAPTDFSAQLKDQTITEFEDAEFTCKLTKEKAAVKWYREGREIREGPRYDRSKYITQNNNPTHKAAVFVYSARRTRARLFVEGELFVSRGSDIVFEVELNKDRVEVKWMRNNMIIVQGDKYQMISEGKVHRLQVCEIRPRDQGEYRIVAKDKDARAKLELAAVPKIKTTDQNLVTDAGKPFIMTVPYDAYPRADAEWFFEGTSLPVQNIDTSMDRTEYRLKSPTKEDQGRYKVVIKNKHGEGENLRVVDTVDGEVSLAWDEPESDGGSKIIAYVVERRDVKRKTWTLATDRADTPDGPTVTTEDAVQAKNKFGKHHSKIATHIHIPSPHSNVPDAPENVAVESVNKFGATITWEPPKFDGGSEITAYVIELRDRTSVKWEAALVCGASDRSAMLNDVVENKEYIFRVRAENKAGIGRPSAATNPVKIMDPIGLEVIVPQPLTIRVPITGYPTPVAKWTFGEKEYSESPHFDIHIFSCAAMYYITTTLLYIDFMFGLSSLDKPGPPAAFDISEITNESCLLAWNPPRDDGGSPITNYIVESRQCDKEEWVKLSATVKHTTFKASKLTALKDYIFRKKYVIRVRAINSVGVSDPSDVSDKVSTKDPDCKQGQTSNLGIQKKAIPAPKMVWQKDTVECKAGDRLTVTVEMNSAHLELLKCTRADGGAYTITLENSLGTATGTINVKVIGKVICMMLRTYNIDNVPFNSCSSVVVSFCEPGLRFPTNNLDQTFF
uniref:Uncharacterized protein n=1 Tax=Amphilophus citrinellus TaxID=61819 RepID=A0A3Q0SLB3_AMPCI